MSKYSGGCLCGAIRYEVTGEPVRVAHCHCDDCRRATGASFATNVFFKEDDIKILQGTPKQFRHAADSGNTMTKEFCGDCGSQLFGIGSGSADTVTSLVVLIEIGIRFPPWFHSSGLRQDSLGRVVILSKVSRHGQDVLADPALVGHVIDQVSDQMNSHAPDFTLRNGQTGIRCRGAERIERRPVVADDHRQTLPDPLHSDFYKNSFALIYVQIFCIYKGCLTGRQL